LEGSSAGSCRSNRSGTDKDAFWDADGPGGSGLSKFGGCDTMATDEKVVFELNLCVCAWPSIRYIERDLEDWLVVFNEFTSSGGVADEAKGDS
jgi:hypothetical protein